MKKGIRATYIVARLINNKPVEESMDAYLSRVGLPRSLSIEKLKKRKDLSAGILYRVCKIFGYQVICYNPKPPNGLDKMYVLGTGTVPIPKPPLQGVHHVTRDDYTGEVYRVPRKYKRKKFKKVA